MYGRIYRVVEPKRQRLNAAQSQLKDKQAALADAKAKLAEVSRVLNTSKEGSVLFNDALNTFSYGSVASAKTIKTRKEGRRCFI